jgi:iron transport multicopper oxidase
VPGGTYIYDFFTDIQEGTYWWHAHNQIQYMDGLRGPFIIRNPANTYNVQLDATLQLADWYHDQTQVLLAWYLNGKTNPDGAEPVFKSGLLNGRGQFDCAAGGLAPPACVQVPQSQVVIPRGGSYSGIFI